MLAYDHVITLRADNYNILAQLEDDKIMAHQIQNLENKELLDTMVEKKI
jgi:hypothetical protein